MKHLQYTDRNIKQQLRFSDGLGRLMWPGVHAGDSGGLRFRTVHEGLNPCRTVYEFCGGYDVLHPAVFHLREETKSGYFCVRHTAKEEHQRRPILPLLACMTMNGDTCQAQKYNVKAKQNRITNHDTFMT